MTEFAERGRLLMVEAMNRMASSGIPNWVEVECPGCNSLMKVANIRSVQLHFDPKYYGNVSFDFHCLHCNSVSQWHIESGITSVEQVPGVLTERRALVNRDVLMQSGSMNLTVDSVTDKPGGGFIKRFGCASDKAPMKTADEL